MHYWHKIQNNCLRQTDLLGLEGLKMFTSGVQMTR